MGPLPSPRPRAEQTPIFAALCRDRGWTLPDPEPPVPEPRGRHRWRDWPVTADPDPTTEEVFVGDHHDHNGDGVADHADYRADLRGQIADVDWDAARVETYPVSNTLVTVDADEDHAHDEDTAPVENGERLDELTDDGGIDQGVFGDGAYVPAHWWEVA